MRLYQTRLFQQRLYLTRLFRGPQNVGSGGGYMELRRSSTALRDYMDDRFAAEQRKRDAVSLEDEDEASLLLAMLLYRRSQGS